MQKVHQFLVYQIGLEISELVRLNLLIVFKVLSSVHRWAFHFSALDEASSEGGSLLSISFCCSLGNFCI